MTTALTGSMGWTGLHPFQLGGPPLVNTFARTIPALACPLIAHAYQNDGVTFLGTFSVLNLPPLGAVTANGGYDQITLEVASRSSSGSIYGQVVHGNSTYGGSFNITQGNLIRLSFQGGDGSIVYSGIVEDLPDSIAPGKVSHQIVLSPLAFELDDAHSTSVYTRPADIADIVRDAVRQMLHCSCDQVSVPSSIGVVAPSGDGGGLDFRQQTVKQQIDTCRSIAGPTWFWFVDELGRLWFQAMGSTASYTLMSGVHYEERSSTSSIQSRKNQVVVVGGVPQGGSANAVGIYNGSSQATLGIRALFPDLSVPNISDAPTLGAIAANVGALLDRVWNRVVLKVHRPFSSRIHASQPGGAMVRYWEPIVTAFGESESGGGNYTGPFIAQRVDYDGLHQTVTAGNMPVTSQTDVQNMVNTLVARIASTSIQIAAAALNLTQQVVTGGFQSASNTGSPARWVLDQSSLRVYDGTATSYGAPSGAGVIVELSASGALFLGGSGQGGSSSALIQITDPNGIARFQAGNLAANGISPSQWGGRVNDASGSPIWDALGLVGGKVMNVLGSSQSQPYSPVTLTGVGGSSGISGTGGEVSITSISFSLSRTGSVLLMGTCAAAGWTSSGTVPLLAPVYIRVAGQSNSASGAVVHSSVSGSTTAPSSVTPLQVLSLPAGSYTANLWWNSLSTLERFEFYAYNLFAFQLGN